MADSKEKKVKVKQSTSCKNGEHTFLVTESFTKGQHKKATKMRCRHCLIAMNIEEIETQEWKEENGIN